MKVHELIALLGKHDPEAEVFALSGAGNRHPLQSCDLGIGQILNLGDNVTTERLLSGWQACALGGRPGAMASVYSEPCDTEEQAIAEARAHRERLLALLAKEGRS